MARTGRKPKYSEEIVARIVEAVRLGATYEHAARYGGISDATLYVWMKEKPDFLDKLKAADGEATVEWLRKIEKAAAEGTWQAAAWKLERRHPKEYGRQAPDLSVSAQSDGPLKIVVERIDHRPE